MTQIEIIRKFDSIGIGDLAEVGGKNASLGEMMRHTQASGVRIPDGFCTTASAYRAFIARDGLRERMQRELDTLDVKELTNLHQVANNIRTMMLQQALSPDVQDAVCNALLQMRMEDMSVAVRSSATAEDLPTASFAGQHDSFLNVSGTENVLKAIRRCYASLFNDRAIKYRIDNGFKHMDVALSVGVQRMVRSDLACAGVAFSVDPDSGFRHCLYLTSSWGLCENIVQGAVNPDEYYFFKASIGTQKRSLVYRRLGSKELTMTFNHDPDATTPLRNVATDPERQQAWTLNTTDAECLARWCLSIERHYGIPMDIEWAKDGITQELFIVQARPMTSRSNDDPIGMHDYALKTFSTVLCSGKAVGRSIVSGRVCIVQSLNDAVKVQQGDIIVAEITNPDWNALLRKAVSIITNKGGRTSHASIVARELGIPAVVGTHNATQVLRDGQIVTVCCSEGEIAKVYEGKLEWTLTQSHVNESHVTNTAAMLILADPDKAMHLSRYPNAGVGLMRLEFVINNVIRVHPMALVQFDQLPDGQDKHVIRTLTASYTDKREYFIERLSEAVAMVAAAFHPKDVIVRMSDFKTNEYAQLVGGQYFEPEEENPMLGFRGASRYYNDRYRAAFGMECAAIRRVRDECGLTNVKVMIPFCRTVEEGIKVLDVMKDFGLAQGENGLEVYVMAEIPSNVILADRFAAVFDGFSIGSNDLTQLTLGLDRDSSIVSDLFDENNPAVKALLSQVIATARSKQRKIGLCGQAPSDFPEFARFLVHEGIDSISFNPDALLQGIANIVAAEKELQDD